jgi:hypothetical protein
MARLETVRPATVALEPAFLVAGHGRDGEPNLHDAPSYAPLPCAGCGRVHRDRLVRFFEVRLTSPQTSGGLEAHLTIGPLDGPSSPRGKETPAYA